MKPLLFTLLIWMSSLIVHGQILFSESFNVLLDTTQKVMGSITPELKIQTQKETLIEFNNMTDMVIRLKKNSLSIANKIEFNKFGSEVFLSGGYVYTKFRENLDKHFTIEYFAQVHWAEARGLAHRYSAGPTMRLKIIKKPNLGLFFGTGPIYEFEEWNYDAVQDEHLPATLEPITTQHIKNATYVSFKHHIFSKVFIDLSLYHQAQYNQLFSTPRLASSSRVSYQLTKNLQALVMYQNIYDYNPVVPIDNWFHRILATIAISF
ncbi:MAG: DUF481 domain-containing protein [Cyclobacteriaceae bacterium]|nr:DUF481 domain-containing protein [Cyclobacteriaceae bacterium]